LHRISKARKIGSKLKARRCVLVLRMVTPLQADQAVRPASVSIDGAAKTMEEEPWSELFGAVLGGNIMQYPKFLMDPNGFMIFYAVSSSAPPCRKFQCCLD